MLNLFCTSNIQGWEFCWHGFMKYMFHIVMCCDTCEPICFCLVMMLNTIKLYGLIPVWLTFMFTQGHRVTRRLELVQSIRCKAVWSNWNICNGWLCKGDDCKEVLKYSRYVPFEHLLFLFRFVIIWEKSSCEYTLWDPELFRNIDTAKSTSLQVVVANVSDY